MPYGRVPVWENKEGAPLVPTRFCINRTVESGSGSKLASVGDFRFVFYEVLTANSQTAYKILNIGGFLAWVGQIKTVATFQLNG